MSELTEKRLASIDSNLGCILCIALLLLAPILVGSCAISCAISGELRAIREAVERKESK